MITNKTMSSPTQSINDEYPGLPEDHIVVETEDGNHELRHDPEGYQAMLEATDDKFNAEMDTAPAPRASMSSRITGVMPRLLPLTLISIFSRTFRLFPVTFP